MKKIFFLILIILYSFSIQSQNIDIQNYKLKEFQTELYQDGGVYYGEMIKGGSNNNVRHGIGQHTWEKPFEMHIGEWKNDLRDGLGVHIVEPVLYCGEFKNDYPNGYGVLYPNKDTIFKGQIYNGAEGYGVVYFTEGKRFGEWKNNKLNGIGIIIDSDGSINMQGRFKNNELIESFKVPESKIKEIFKAEDRAIKVCEEANALVDFFNNNK